MLKRILLTFFIFSIFLSCSTRKPFYSFKHRKWKQGIAPADTSIKHSIFLVGDAGAPKTDGSDPLFNTLTHHLNSLDQSENQTNSIIYLGDNIYENGMPEYGDPAREDAEKALLIQMDMVKEFDGRLFIIPGNHDWNHSKKGGYKAIIREQRYVESYLDSAVFFPKNGCPGPVEISMGEDMVIIFLDTEWYLHDHFKPSYPDCTVESKEDFFFEFKRAVKRNEGKHILVAMHHPLFSNGNHGGRFSLKDNLFPLTLINKNLVLPLPGIGSIYTLLRKYGISDQDIPNSEYQELKKGLLDAVKDVKNVTFASGHDHNLQLNQREGKNFIVSGSASKVNYARQGLKAEYVHSVQGFSKINYHSNGEVWVEFFKVGDKPEGELTFRIPLYSLDPATNPLINEEYALEDYKDSTATIVAGAGYKASGLRRFWLGDHYRDEWTTPVEVDYLDINNFAGGLTPIKKGGGQQTISLRMMGKDGNQYNLRSINKNPAGAIPGVFRNTFAQDLVQDQISSAHPYGAFAIAPMAKAAGLYHTNPKLVYIPYSPVLGEYLSTFGGMTALLEIRPDEDLSEFKRFGRSENAVSTSTMLEHLREDNDNEVDAEFFLKTRLFDLLINDWDRHEDQWRWSEVENEGKGSTFEAIPRDRDQVFTKYDGVIPYIASRKWAVRNVTNFGYDYEDALGSALSGMELDRQLLGELSFDTWKKLVLELQKELTDSVIEDAIRQLPKEIFPISGEEIIAKLKSRRDKLLSAAKTWYHGINKEVDILGSDKHENFEVDRQSDGTVTVTVHKTKKEGNKVKEIYRRTFDPCVTKEIRIYTFEGNDVVNIIGADSRSIKINVITGRETELISNQTEAGRVKVYQRKYFNKAKIKGEKIKIRRSNREYITAYTPEDYKYTYVGPRASIQFNQDAGMFVGAGVHWKTFGFQHDPFESSHTLMANYATSINAFNIGYDGEFPDLFGHNYDLVINSHYYSPQYVLNYFGDGNGTPNTQGIDFYRVDMAGFSQKVLFRKSVGAALKMGFGPTFNYFDPSGNDDNIVQSEIFASEEDLNPGRFLGTQLFFNIDKRDNTIYTRNGLQWNNQVNYMNDLNGASEFVKVKTDFSVYLTPNLPIPITLASRFGVESNFGNFPFYQSAFLGGNGNLLVDNSNLRGFRMQRFAGETSVFHNTELRMGISRVKNYVFNGYWGIFGFIDQGRVWSDNIEFDSDKWHRGYGPGIWVNFFKFIMTSAGYGFSDEGEFFYVRAGMFF